MIFIDLSGLFYLSIYRLEKAAVELNAHNLECSLAQSVFWYKKKFQDEYGHVVICCDSKSNWRRDLFPYYKQRRRDKRSSDEKDWDSIFDMFSLVKSNFSKNMQETVLEIDGLEGDDLIALGTKLITKKPHLIISSDKDMTQLLMQPGVKMFHVLHQEFAEFNDRDFILQVLKGDRSDGVPSILCEDDHFVNEDAPIKRLTKKYTDPVDSLDPEIIRKVFSDFEDVDKIVEHFKRNKTLIDLDEIPEKYKDIFKQEFVKQYNAQKNNNSVAYYTQLGINME